MTRFPNLHHSLHPVLDLPIGYIGLSLESQDPKGPTLKILAKFRLHYFIDK